MVLIIGGGVIGLSIGWQLLREGISVKLIEEKIAGQQTSYVAAGLLSPYADAELENDALLQLCEKSFDVYPQFLQELSSDSKCHISIEQKGTLYVGIDRDDQEWLKRQYDHKKKRNRPVQWMDKDEIHLMEPLLSPRITSGIFFPTEGQVNNRKLLEYLKIAYLNLGGVLIENTKVEKIVTGNGKVVSALTNEEMHFSDIVINCAGPWVSQIAPLKTLVKPNKGQIVTLRMENNYVLNRVIRTPRVYLVPKSDGLLRMGATSEDLGFDERFTAGALLEILESAWEVFPAMEQFEVQELNVGFRPQTENLIPLMGSTSIEGYFQACGHGRLGILLAPLTAYYLTEEIKCRFSSMASHSL